MKQLIDSRIAERLGHERRAGKIVPLAVSGGDGDGNGAGGHGRATAVLAIFENHHFARCNVEPLGRLQIDLGVRFAVCDVFRREDRRESRLVFEYSQDMLDKGAAAAGGDGLGNRMLFEDGEQFDQTGHRRETLAEDAWKNLVGLGKQLLDGGLQRMGIDHDLQGDVTRPAHHAVEQVLSKRVAAAAEQLRANLLVQLFGVEHQAVEIEDDGAGRVQRLRFRVQQGNMTSWVDEMKGSRVVSLAMD
jgi:hypothetical protein